MLNDFFILSLVGFIWGSTNYLIEIYYKEDDLNNDKNSLIIKIINYLKINYKAFICFLLNQCGSILFYFCLGSISLSLTVIISNTFSFITTLLFELFHKKKKFKKEFYYGFSLIIFGMGICLLNNKEI